MRKSEAPPAGLLESLHQASGNTGSWTTYDCKLVTPLYGGGVQAGVVDKQMPIRASAIRGQLRFWWRVLQRQRFMNTDGLDSQAMFAAEVAIWGGIGAKGPTASKVSVRVSTPTLPTCQAAFEYKPDKRPGKEGQYKPTPEAAPFAEGYSLFPVQGKLSEDKHNILQAPKELARPELSFVLSIRLDKELKEHQRSETLDALRWWASFGGVGARTRRGVGAIWIESKAITPVSADEVEAKHGVLKLVPINPKNTPFSPSSAWKESVSRLKAYRQGVNIGRNDRAADSDSPAGRSLWPEADTIRALSGNAWSRHEERLVQGDVFPRAAFGLPIVFHFKDVKKGDPLDHVLEPTDISDKDKRDRMASPLILRPYWNGSAWQPAALLLPGWQAALDQRLKFKGQAYTPDHWPADPSQRNKLAKDIQPMNGRGDDPLTAFMQFFEKGQ